MSLKTNGIFFFLELIFFQIIFRRGFNYILAVFILICLRVCVRFPRRSKEINAVPEMPSARRRRVVHTHGGLSASVPVREALTVARVRTTDSIDVSRSSY